MNSSIEHHPNKPEWANEVLNTPMRFKMSSLISKRANEVQNGPMKLKWVNVIENGPKKLKMKK